MGALIFGLSFWFWAITCYIGARHLAGMPPVQGYVNFNRRFFCAGLLLMSGTGWIIGIICILCAAIYG